MFVVVNFNKYISPPRDPKNTTFILIPPIKGGVHTYIPLKMAWELMIHKYQGMGLPKDTLNIGMIEF